MNWNVGPEVLYWVAITITQTSVISENASVIHRVSRAGPTETTIAPTRGIPPATVSQGKPVPATVIAEVAIIRASPPEGRPRSARRR